MERTNEQIVMTVSKNSIIVNVLLSIFKFYSGVLSHSAAMISDSIHSISDVLGTIIVIIGVKLVIKSQIKSTLMGMKGLNVLRQLSYQLFCLQQVLV